MSSILCTLARNAVLWARSTPPSRCFNQSHLVAPLVTQRLNYFSSETLNNARTKTPPQLPTNAQLRAVQMQAAIPMVGFGFMDQTIMIHAGNAIDCTIGVSLGISTLAAAAVGQIVANAGGILFGESLQRFFSRYLWVPKPNLNATQLSLPIVEKARFSGTILGIIAGCVLGLGNLLCIDTKWSHDMKMTKALLMRDDAFEVRVSSQDFQDKPASTLTICGPDVDGILAIMLSALHEEGYSVLEMSAKPKQEGSTLYEDIFVVRRQGEAIPEEELAGLIKKLLKEKIIAKFLEDNKKK